MHQILWVDHRKGVGLGGCKRPGRKFVVVLVLGCMKAGCMKAGCKMAVDIGCSFEEEEEVPCIPE